MKKCLVVMITLMLVAVLSVGCAGIPSLPMPSPSTSAPATPAPSTPIPTPSTPSPSPTPTGEGVNFRLLLSDEVNAIDDFEHLWVTINNIGVHPAGEEDGWIEPSDFDPVEVDLTELKETNATEIWSGELEDGEYVKVFIYISSIDYELEDGGTTNVKLPSGKLHISQPFEVTDGEVTDFVYDITVIKAGNSGKYILKPQIAESGPNQNFVEVEAQGKTEKHKEQNEEQHGKPEKGELNLEILEGDIAPGENITLQVTFEGEPVTEAMVEVNSEELDDLTDEDGEIIFTIPANADKLEIEVNKGDLEGELEIEFEE